MSEQARQTTKAPPNIASIPGSVLQRQCACGQHTGGGECEECRKKNESTLQRAAVSPGPVNSVPPVVHDVLHSSGQPLDSATRAFMEPRFGHDFSRVRMHTDGRAAESARAVNALAYTVGRDVVFGAGQHAPGTMAGKRLMAHELTHVVQQGQTGATGQQASLEMASPQDTTEREAESVANHLAGGQPVQVDRSVAASLQPVRPGVIQRTPAPPSAASSPAPRDLNRIRIDAVPDFLASSLTAPRVVNAHVNDPAVVQLTWELYDPSDQMMPGSFSTMPGSAKATTAPFALEPSHFSGAGFVPGKYLLRCVGLNARHQSVVYADRDFNVLRTDLTTGTALPTTYGELTFTQYDKTDANPPGRPNYQVNVTLAFLPSTSVACSNVTFIQSVQTINDQGQSQQNTVNIEQDARQIPLAWSIDRVAGAPSPFYIAGRNPTTGTVEDVPGWGRSGGGGRGPRPATLIDRPSWNQPNTARFETCAVCRGGTNRGQVYGCATWGYTANSAGQVTLMPRGFRQMPSDQFEEARATWNRWRTSVPAATRPEEAPALRSP